MTAARRWLWYGLLGAAPLGGVALSVHGGPLEGFKVAFLGDQGDDQEARDVLAMILAEGADAVVHAGDFDYGDDPAAWDAMISEVLGPCFPYFACAGNHDESAFYGPGGYQEHLAARMDCLGLEWDGDLGVRSSHYYRGVYFVLTAPGIFDGGDGDDVHAPYIAGRLAADASAWRVSAWHVLMEAMQVGGKSDESGWGVYEASRAGGAIIATAHEHSYARTHPLASCVTQTVASYENTFEIAADLPGTPADEGVTFAFHNGLGGHSIRDQERCLPVEPPYGCQGEWASIYAEQQGATHGALFGEFRYGGDPCRARFYFKALDGSRPDEFYVRSAVGHCATCPGDVNGDGYVATADLLDLVGRWGPCTGGCPGDFDGSGSINWPDLAYVLWMWGPCGTDGP